MKSITNKIDWKKMNGLIPAVVQDARTRAVLMLGYMDKAALQKTQASGFVWFYSRSKKRLWKKGETSGNALKAIDVALDCDGDALLVKAIPAGPVCHTGSVSCFGKIKTEGEVLRELFETIKERKRTMPKGSYTASLFTAGLDKIALKVSEESLEVVQAATKENKKRLTEETADLLYHLLVLLAEREVNVTAVEAELRKRASRKR